jgi:hypothetical protein
MDGRVIRSHKLVARASNSTPFCRETRENRDGVDARVMHDFRRILKLLATLWQQQRADHSKVRPNPRRKQLRSRPYHPLSPAAAAR